MLRKGLPFHRSRSYKETQLQNARSTCFFLQAYGRSRTQRPEDWKKSISRCNIDTFKISISEWIVRSVMFFNPAPLCLQKGPDPGLNTSIENEHFKARMKLSSKNGLFVRGGMVFLWEVTREINQHPRLPSNFMTHALLQPSAFPDSLNKSCKGVHYKHPVLTLYEKGKILTEGFSDGRIPFSFEPWKPQAPRCIFLKEMRSVP